MIRAAQFSIGSVVGLTAEDAEGRGGFQLADHPLEAVFDVKHVEVDPSSAILRDPPRPPRFALLSLTPPDHRRLARLIR